MKAATLTYLSQTTGCLFSGLCDLWSKAGVDVSLTGVQALSDRGRFDQVTSTQVAGDEMVEVSHQVLSSCSSHVWTVLGLQRSSFTKVSRCVYWKL